MEKVQLYDLEFEVIETRREYLNMVKYDDLTLKEVLDLGFNSIYILRNNVFISIFKDNYKEKYILDDDYYLEDEEVLNSKVQYIECEINNDYLEITVEFKDENIKNKFNELINEEIR